VLLLHGFTAHWRTWEPILPDLETRHEVLAPTLPGHAGGPPLPAGGASDTAMVDAVEAVMDEAGWRTAHIVGNSLGGCVAFLLAARGRARSVVALAPAGGWAQGDPAFPAALAYFRGMQKLVREVAPHADRIVATPEGRRRATGDFASNDNHMSSDLIKNLMLGAAACDGAAAFMDFAEREGWHLSPSRIRCPVRFIWGGQDQILSLPGAAVRYRSEWFPAAEWCELPGSGHCPQLDHPHETSQLILEWIS
jgi:pimeloyl-ACP methyl ester carboxylesterase